MIASTCGYKPRTSLPLNPKAFRERLLTVQADTAVEILGMTRVAPIRPSRCNNPNPNTDRAAMKQYDR